jgi:hypothetical protein
LGVQKTRERGIYKDVKFTIKQKEKNNWGLWFGVYLLTIGSHLEMLHAKAILEAAFARVKAEPVADATGNSLSESDKGGGGPYSNGWDTASGDDYPEDRVYTGGSHITI